MSIDQSSTLLDVPLAHIAPSPTNPRNRHQNQASNLKAWKLEDLSESIKLHGVMQPVVVRANVNFREGNGRPRYELVAGERRWRASQLAGASTIPALLRNLTDFEVLELQVIENIQREDLHPLEEAEGYQKLLRKSDGLQGYATVDDLAARLGKSRRYVFNRLALLTLCKPARDAFYEGTINASVALVIATIPDQADQAEATARILQGFNGEPYTARVAQDYVQQQFRLTLTKARFDIKAVYTTAGPCGECPKRSGAKPDMFADATSGDLCLDSKCFEAKEEEAHQRTLQAARDAGYTVLSGDAARKLMPSPSMVPQGHKLLDKPCPEFTDSKKTLREILGAGFKDVLVLDHPTSETAIAIANDAAIKKALKAKGLLRKEEPKPAPAPEKSTAASASAPAAAPKPPKPYTGEEMQRAADAASGAMFCKATFMKLHAAITTAKEPPVMALRLLLIQQLDNYASYEGLQLIYEAHGWKQPDREWGILPDLTSRVEKCTPRELADLLVESLICEQLSDNQLLQEFDADSTTERLANHYGVDLDAIQADADKAAAQQIQDEQNARLATAESNRKGAKPTQATAAFAATTT